MTAELHVEDMKENIKNFVGKSLIEANIAIDCPKCDGTVYATCKEGTKNDEYMCDGERHTFECEEIFELISKNYPDKIEDSNKPVSIKKNETSGMYIETDKGLKANLWGSGTLTIMNIPMEILLKENLEVDRESTFEFISDSLSMIDEIKEITVDDISSLELNNIVYNDIYDKSKIPNEYEKVRLNPASALFIGDSSVYPMNRCKEHSYEPEVFPGLKIKWDNGVTSVLFNSGTVNILGASSFKEVKETWGLVVDTLDYLNETLEESNDPYSTFDHNNE